MLLLLLPRRYPWRLDSVDLRMAGIRIRCEDGLELPADLPIAGPKLSQPIERRRNEALLRLENIHKENMIWHQLLSSLPPHSSSKKIGKWRC